MFSAKKSALATPAHTSQPVANSSVSDADAKAFCKVLAQLEQGKAVEIAANVPAEYRKTVASLARALQSRDEADLARTVRFSMQASDAMAAVAKITGNVRTMSEHSGAMSAAIEELNASIGQISETATSSSAEMEQAAGTARESSDALGEVNVATREISDSMASMEARVSDLQAAAEQIGEFVGTIDAIASQTNLLALNATIEAARAGEAGRGFAVVASEVKSLSGQTQTATDDIRKRIERLSADMQELLGAMNTARNAVDRGQELAGDANTRVAEVESVVQGNATRMGELAGVLAEQSTATAELSQGITRVAGEADEAASNAEEVIAAVVSSEKLVNDQFAVLDGRDIHDYVLQRAKSDHFLWKKNLSEMLVGLNNLTASELADHTSCRLGKWYGKVTDPTIRKHPAFAVLDGPHAAVHTHGRQAAQRFAEGDLAGAQAKVREMEAASVEVVKLLDELLAR